MFRVQFQLRPGDGWVFVGRGDWSGEGCWTGHWNGYSPPAHFIIRQFKLKLGTCQASLILIRVCAGPSRGIILWNRNPLAASTNSLDHDTSDNAAQQEDPTCDEVPVALQAPESCERMITISSVVNHSLASLPLHALADRPQSSLCRRPSGVKILVVLTCVN